MRRIFDVLVLLMVVLSSNAFIPFMSSSGAIDQGALVLSSGANSFLLQLPRIWGICTVAILILVLHSRSNIVLKGTIPIRLILFLAGISFAWALYPVDAIRAFLLVVAIIGLIHAQISLYGVPHAMRLLNRICSIILWCSLFTVIFIPTYGVAVGDHSGSWQGVFEHKNSLGNFSAFSLLIFFWRIGGKRRISDFVLVALALILIVGSRSSTAMVAGLLIILINFALMFEGTARRLLRWRNYIFVVVAFLLIVQTYISVFAPSVLLPYFEADVSFTGRTAIWGQVFEYFLQRPILGHGFSQFFVANVRADGDLLDEFGFIVGSTHSGFFDALYSLGIIGLTLMILALLSGLNSSRDSRSMRIHGAAIFALMTLNFAESRFLGFNFFFVVFVYSYYFAFRHLRNLKRSSAPIIRV